MIYKISGIVEFKDDTLLVLEASGGISYSIFATKSLLAISNIGEKSSAFIEVVMRENDISLYGFKTLDEKKMFLLLTTVQGVGTKSSLNLVSTLGVEKLNQAIVFEDITSLCSTQGIGPKIAKRISNELKTKVQNNRILPDTQTTDTTSDVLSALLNLGFKKADAKNVISDIMTSSNSNWDFETLLKESLKRIKK